MADQPDIVASVRKDYDTDKKHHDSWCLKVDRWYRAYKGAYEDAQERAKWKSDFSSRYLFQIIETLVAGMVDPNPRWKVKARPKFSSPEEIEAMRQGAKQLELLLAYQRDVDGMMMKQRQHRLQGLITGLSVWKTYWRYEEKLKSGRREARDILGQPVMEDYEELLPTYDDPCVDVVDVRDFIWPESAISLEAAPRLHHRVWMTFDRLKQLERIGYYSNVDQLKDNEQGSAAEESNREQTLWETDRTQGRIEVIEHWVEGGKRVVTIANGNVKLSDRPNPFEHGHYPFIACSPYPDLFRIPGTSVVELVDDLQRMVRDLQRQRHDSLEFLNNVIILEPENSLLGDNVFAPGERWLVEAADNAPAVLEMPTFPAEVTLQAEQLLKNDIQAIPGASPALLGQAEQVEQTATEISLTANLAQRRLAAQKQQFTVADIRVGEHWMELNAQFLDDQRYIAIVGRDGEEAWQMIDPASFQEGHFSIDVEQMDESLIRQERLAEATSRLQVILTALPAAAAIGVPINLKAYVDDVLDAGGIQDKERYWSASPQPAGMLQQGGPAQPGQQAPMAPEGFSAPQAFDMNSPSNAFSQSPVAAISRLMSQGGGPANA